jgi:hypothetical protein
MTRELMPPLAARGQGLVSTASSSPHRRADLAILGLFGGVLADILAAIGEAIDSATGGS